MPMELVRRLPLNQPNSWHGCAATGDIVAVGDGRVGDVTQTFDLEVGETILYSKFGIGVTDLTVQGAPHILIREDDVIGTMPWSGATAEDVPHLKPAADRVLLKVPRSRPLQPCHCSMLNCSHGAPFVRFPLFPVHQTHLLRYIVSAPDMWHCRSYHSHLLDLENLMWCAFYEQDMTQRACLAFLRVNPRQGV